MDSPNSYKSIDYHLKNINKYCNSDKVLKFVVGTDFYNFNDRRITYDDLLEKVEDYKE